MDIDTDAAVALLNEHYRSFHAGRPYAERTGHSVPSDTKSWSEILVALLTGISGRGRQKGSDLSDGSDVKAANLWSAIDTPRFNGCAPAGRTSKASKKAGDLSAFDDIPHLFFVLWDERGVQRVPRCRIWVVSPPTDPQFRRVVGSWYEKVATGEIKSTNFQLHPPRNVDHNVIRNRCGNLEYPLFFHAEHTSAGFTIVASDPSTLTTGLCRPAP